MMESMSIKDYLLSEIGKNTQKVSEIDAIIEAVMTRTHSDQIDRVPGDGDCLLRSILRSLKKIPNIMMEIIIALCIDTDILIPGDDWMDFENKFCILLRNCIQAKWKEATQSDAHINGSYIDGSPLPFRGELIYHMNENAIDGLAIIMAMKLLHINKLNVYQAYDGADRKRGWRQYTTSKSFHNNIDVEPLEISIITLNGTHYNGLV